MKLGKKIIALALFGMAVSGFAGPLYVSGAKIQEVITYTDGAKALIIFNKSSTAFGCGSSRPDRAMIDVSTSGGKATLSAALTAFTSGAQIVAQSYNTCNINGGFFDLQYLRVR